MDFGFSYNFPAIRGVQAKKEYFVVMCPLGFISKIFLFDEEEVPPEYRAQRSLNKARIPEMTNYIVNNCSDYVFSSITASIDGEIKFVPILDAESHKDIGTLSISLDSKFLINDGQHRRAAIEEALKINPELSTETISVVFFQDIGLRNSQQIFSDLNRHAINTTSSLGILYDFRDKLSLITKEIVNRNPFLKRYTDTERVSLSKNSPKLLTLNHIYNTNLKLLGISKQDPTDKESESFIIEFWDMLISSIPEWNLVMNKELTPKELRINYVHGHGAFFEAVGLVGNYLKREKQNDWRSYVGCLAKIDWSRSNTEWEGRLIKNGRVQKNTYTIRLSAIHIKEMLKLPLDAKEIEMNEHFLKGSII